MQQITLDVPTGSDIAKSKQLLSVFFAMNDQQREDILLAMHMLRNGENKEDIYSVDLLRQKYAGTLS